MVDNVLLITIDSLRRDHLPVYGYEEAHTPNISSLAAEGCVFDHAFATGPGTNSSFPAILTGTLPLDFGGLGPLSPQRPRMSEQVREAGLHTGGFQSNLFLSERFNYDVGFDIYKDYQSSSMQFATRIFPRGVEVNNPWIKPVDNIFHLTDLLKYVYRLVRGKPRPYVEAEVITDDFLDWLGHTPSPFFGWVHFMDVHHPCYPPTEYLDRFEVGDVTMSQVSRWYSEFVNDPDRVTDEKTEKMIRLYDAAIAYADDQIGRIVGCLKESGRFDDSLLIVTSDHGELFGEYGRYAKPHRMYDELLHVPLIVSDGAECQGTDELVSLVDIPPMIHNVLGIPVPEEYVGKLPSDEPPRDYVIAEHQVGKKAVVGARSEGWWFESNQIRDEDIVYRIVAGEQEIVSGNENPEVDGLRRIVARRLRDLDIDRFALDELVDGEVEDRLEELGYL